MDEHNNHDHLPNGECLVIEWKGAEEFRSKGLTIEESKEINEKYRAKMRQKMIDDNAKPF